MVMWEMSCMGGEGGPPFIVHGLKQSWQGPIKVQATLAI